MRDPMIHAEHLTKRYGPTLAVDDVSLHVGTGEVVGFLGPNGAGKSTTIRMLTGYLPPTSGSASLAGHDALTDAAAARRQLGYLPESNALYPEMRVDEYLHFVGRLHAMRRRSRRERMGYVTDRCGLSELRRRTIGRLSKGNRQRVGLAAALLHDPAVLILDEPTSGLDPNQITHIRDLIRELGGSHTVLLSTHLLPEAQRVSDRLIVIARGRIVAEGTPEELRWQAHGSQAHAVGGGGGASGGASGGAVHAEVHGDVVLIKAALRELGGLVSYEVKRAADGWARVDVVPAVTVDPRAAMAEAFRRRDLPLRELHREVPSLEAFFVRVTDVGEGAKGSRGQGAEGGEADV